MVNGQVFGGGAGRRIEVVLERPCVWNGTLVPMRFGTETDAAGRFELCLPPTVQMTARDGGETPRYKFTAEGVGSWEFVVPDQPTWSLADHG